MPFVCAIGEVPLLGDLWDAIVETTKIGLCYLESMLESFFLSENDCNNLGVPQ